MVWATPSLCVNPPLTPVAVPPCFAGDMSPFDKEDASAFRKVRSHCAHPPPLAHTADAVHHHQERNGGNYGSGTQELQRRNYVEKKEVRLSCAICALISP